MNITKINHSISGSSLWDRLGWLLNACQSVWKGFEDKIVTSCRIWLQKSDDVNGPPNAPKAKTGL